MSVPTTATGALIDAAGAAAPACLADLVAPEGAILVVAPHPDDETLGCGAAIMTALAAGREVAIALLTGGEGSHPASPSHPPERLKARRRAELDAALEVLGHAGGNRIACHALGLPDTAVPATGAAAERAADTLAGLAREIGAGTLWCTWGGDPHGDHRAAARLARLAAGRLAGAGPVVLRDYAVWGRFGDVAVPARILPLPLGRYRVAKATAMAHYASQLTAAIGDDPGGFRMPPALTRHFASHPEIFIAVDSHEPQPGSDLRFPLPRRPRPLAVRDEPL